MFPRRVSFVSHRSSQPLPPWLVALAMMVFPAAFPGTAQIDDNNSGMSDVWEAIYGPGLDPLADDDGDGFPNWAEALAGTNPFDPNSHPGRLALHRPASGNLVLTWPSVPGVGYHIQASTDLRNWHPVGNLLIGEPDRDSLTWEIDPATVFPGPGAHHRLWNMESGGLASLKQLIANDTPPDETATLTTLEIPQSSPNRDHFGQWLQGWIRPTESGPYTFWLASDDHAELWLSTDHDPANLQPIASVDGWTGFREWEKFPSQQSPVLWLDAHHTYAFEIFHREYSGGDHLSVAWTRPSADPGAREIITLPHLFTSPQSLAQLIEEGGKIFFRSRLVAVDSDDDGVTDYEEYILGLDPHNTTSQPRLDDLENARRILAAENTLTASALVPRAYEASASPAQILLQRAGGITPLSVPYTLSGTAEEGIDYLPLPGQIEFGPGQRTAIVTIHPIDDGLVEPRESVTLTILPGEGYAIGNPGSATVFIDDSEDVLYVAQLRPPDPSLSGGSGTASLRRAGNSLGATLALSFQALTGTFTGAEIYLSSDGLSGPVVYTFPAEVSETLEWDLQTDAGFSREALVAAFDAQEGWVRIRSSAFPDGEIRGRLQLAPGFLSMPEPAPAPAAPTTADTSGEAARFLAQATFGPTPAETAALVGQSYADWIDAQLVLPPSFHLPATQARRTELLATTGADGWQNPRQEIWWEHALHAPDQLRQRMAFALSQILVISQEGALDTSHEGVARYYDQLVGHAFGNYRDLLEEVTLSPMMGTYLSMMRNRKPDPVTGHEPDENYAREIMQLFTIGLNELHPDGSLRLNAEGHPIPTYSQEDTAELAHIFTGWGPHYDPADPPRWSNGTIAQPNAWFLYGYDPDRPMSFYSEYHDYDDRTIVGAETISGDLSGEARLQAALDSLFNHPNMGPFLARQLIQKFVTSNPSPDYVYRVASVFADNGQNVRGDLGATLRAVLLDHEARHPEVRTRLSAGKSSEPLLRTARMFRVFPPLPPLSGEGDNRLFLSTRYSLPEQAVLHSPSVFNFFQPVYSAPGPISRAGLLSPEFQIFAETTAIRQANFKFTALFWGIWTPQLDSEGENAIIRLDLSAAAALLDTPDTTPLEAQGLLLDYLDTHLLFGAMPPALRADIQSAFDALPGWFGYAPDRQLNRVRIAAWLVLNSPEFWVQR